MGRYLTQSLFFTYTIFEEAKVESITLILLSRRIISFISDFVACFAFFNDYFDNKNIAFKTYNYTIINKKAPFTSK